MEGLVKSEKLINIWRKADTAGDVLSTDLMVLSFFDSDLSEVLRI